MTLFKHPRKRVELPTLGRKRPLAVRLIELDPVQADDRERLARMLSPKVQRNESFSQRHGRCCSDPSIADSVRKFAPII